MRIVYKGSNIVEAHIVAGMLNAEEIETYVGGHYLQGGVGDLSPFDFANVFVRDEDYDKAAAIIKDYEAGNRANTDDDDPSDDDFSFLA